MSFLNSIVADLREKRLWPVAAALCAALVAVPVVLAKSTPTAPASTAPPAAPATSPATAVTAVSVSSAVTHSRLSGRTHDPFVQQKLPAPKTPSSPSTAGAASGSAKRTTTPTTTTSTTTSSAPASGTTTVPAPAIIPTATPKPASTELTATQSYHVTLAITNPAGGLDTIDPLERLSVLPSEHEPLLIELGVLKSGHRVLFAVQPGTVVSGPGTCTPGRVDCEVLSLASDKIENLSMQSPSGVVGVAQFAVTAIKVDGHSSPAAADKARRRTSAAGRRLLGNSTSSAFSLFQYKPGLGALVDLRNLTLGGS